MMQTQKSGQKLFFRKGFFLLMFLFLGISGLKGQQFLQIETKNDPQAIKIAIGEQMVIKTTTNEEWTKRKIIKLLYNDNAVLFDDGFEKLNDITAIRLTRPWARILGSGLMTFGAAWFVFGGLGELRNNNDETRFGWDSFAIGITTLGTGFLIDKAFYHRKINLGKRYRLRLIDLRVSSEEH